MKRPARLMGLGNRCAVKLYIPPEYSVNVAEDRTDGMVNYYLSASSGDIMRQIEHLRMLVRSAYLQGVNDVIQAAIQKGLFKE